MKECLIKKVRKRDGRIVDFEIGKIANAIHKALNATSHPDGMLAANLAEKVTEQPEAGAEESPIPSVEQIQDIVERILIDEDYPEVAKAYILYRQMRANVRAARKFVGVAPDEVKVSVNAAKVLSQRYLIKDDQGNVVETPSQLFRRVAIALAASDLLHNPGPKGTFLRHYIYGLFFLNCSRWEMPPSHNREYPNSAGWTRVYQS